jgi:hypothetical protein
MGNAPIRSNNELCHGSIFPREVRLELCESEVLFHHLLPSIRNRAKVCVAPLHSVHLAERSLCLFLYDRMLETVLLRLDLGV